MRTKAILLALLLLAIGTAVPSFGDTIQTLTAGGINFTADLNADTSTNTYTLTFSGTNTLSTAATLNTFALQIFGAGSTADFTIGTAPSVTGWSFIDGAKINNSGSLGCPTSSPGTAGWLCGTADTTADALWIPGNGSFSWQFTGTFDSTAYPLTQLDLMANGLYGINSDGAGSKWAISAPMQGPPTNVPEPASFLLFGTGIATLGPFILRFRK